MEQVQRTCEKLRAVHFSGKVTSSHSCHVITCMLHVTLADVDVMECVLRPYEVRVHTQAIPNVGVVNNGGSVSPSVGSTSLWTAQATNKIPGHTGYLITATMHWKGSC